MGWFSDEDDDDEHDAKELTATLRQQNVGKDTESHHEEEEDPLDAYMSSISATANNNRVCDAASRKEDEKDVVYKGRLDVENEEEATAHWNTASSPGSLWRKRHEEEDADDNREPSSLGLAGMIAKSAMATTFHKAAKAAGSATENDTDEEEEDALFRKQQRDAPIDPLARVNHAHIRYEPFRKSFMTPSNTPAGAAWRMEHGVSCTPSHFDPLLSFERVFPEELLHTIHRCGYTTPTPVQSQTLSVSLSGHDMLVTSPTGSGKTLAYVWPMVLHLSDQRDIIVGDGPIGLVLTPTRELARQVTVQCNTMLKCIGKSVVMVTGGGKGRYQLGLELKSGCEVVVATPGRLIDMVSTNTKNGTNLKRVTILVVDEADRLLDMGFEPQVSSLLDNIRPDRQTLMFSATFGTKVERVAKTWLTNPIRIAVGRIGRSSEHVSQHVLVLPSYEAKRQWLLEMIPTLADLGRMIVFVSSRVDCEEITQLLLKRCECKVDSIHGDKHQSDRNAALSSFRKGNLAALIATDVAARGLDVTNVMTVVNFDVAKNLDSHVHRIGRAGRLNREGQQSKGIAYTLLTPKNADFAKTLMESFQREGREVSDELMKLAMQSKHAAGKRQKWNKGGLGFRDHDDEAGGPFNNSSSFVTSTSNTSDSSSYYRPSQPPPKPICLPNPAAKKSRWG